MITLRVDVTSDNDPVTIAIKNLCESEINAFHNYLNQGWQLTRMYSTASSENKHPVPCLIQEALDSESILAGLFACEPVIVLAGTQTLYRENVLCNLIHLCFFDIPNTILAELIVDWTTTSNSEKFETALCRYYAEISNLTSGCLFTRGDDLQHDNYLQFSDTLARVTDVGAMVWVPGLSQSNEERCMNDTSDHSEVVCDNNTISEPQARINHLLLTTFHVLRTNREQLQNTCRTVLSNDQNPTDTYNACSHDGLYIHEYTMMSRFGLTHPNFRHSCLENKGMAQFLDVSYAHKYLMSACNRQIRVDFETALSPGCKNPDWRLCHDPQIVHILRRSSFEILNTIAPQCDSCGCEYRSCHDHLERVPNAAKCRYAASQTGHGVGVGGTIQLVACLSQMHALQLLEMLICE